jgi:hypothetical protein
MRAAALLLAALLTACGGGDEESEEGKPVAVCMVKQTPRGSAPQPLPPLCGS